jgi:signal transduction histidine kinase/ActR/RegA family two-component response regulator
MQNTLETKGSSDIEEEYEQLKKRLYCQFFKGFNLVIFILLSNETVRVVMYSCSAEIYNLIISLIFMALGIGFTAIMKKHRGKIITILFFCHYLAMFHRVHKSDIGYLGDPANAFYMASNLALYEGIICMRIPRTDYQILFTIATCLVRFYFIRPKDFIPVLFHILLPAAKLFLTNQRERHCKHLFQIYMNSKEQLMKFKNLVVRDFPHGIAVIHRNLTKYLLINDIFKGLNANYGSEVYSHLDQFILKQTADGAESEANHGPNQFAGQTSLLTLIKKEFPGRQRKEKNTFCMTDHKIHPSCQKKFVYGITLMDIVWDDEPAIVVVTRDVTQQFNLTNQKIADAQKNEVLATVSHELRTPLNGILGMIQIMEKKIHDPELLNCLSICKNSGTLLVSLVNSILDLNQLQANKLKLHYEEFNVEGFLMSIAALFEFQCQRKGISLRVKIHPTTPKIIITDKDRLSQILINLVGNALKFTSQGNIVITASQNNQYEIKFSVEDTGIGIKDEDKAKLFKIFGKLENDQYGVNHQGVGLGLNISNNLVWALCDGCREGIKVESEYGKGSKFTFMIKNRKRRVKIFSEEDHEAVLNKQLQESEMKEYRNISSKMLSYSWQNNLSSDVFQRSQRKESPLDMSYTPCISRSANFSLSHDSLQHFQTDPGIEFSALYNSRDNLFKAQPTNPYILIVDDNPFNLTVAEHMISTLGYHVKSVLSGEAAVNLVSQNDHRNQPIKVIFMDCQMPVMDGYETTKVLKEKMKKEEIPNIPVIAFTANDSEKDKEKCKKVGMSDYLTKPLSEAKLKEIIFKYIKS